jgi:hypothetical protein
MPTPRRRQHNAPECSEDNRQELEVRVMRQDTHPSDT